MKERKLTGNNIEIVGSILGIIASISQSNYSEK